ncbi:MAG TPA: hypothetical protein VJ997_09820 [Longimicrobiales bacterium]|nr:hypothetical protein [Longimicrobiales bacterium]
MTTLQGREAAFAGRVAADATHEMRNVLAIVKESAGLMEDLLGACVDGAPVDRARMDRALGRIDAQVGRGAELMSHLNRFAHSLERKPERLDLGREIEQAVFLGRRSARKRRILLSAQAGATAPPAEADSFGVQMAIAEAVEWWLARIPEGATVRLRPVDAAGRPAVEMTGETADGVPLPSPGSSPGWDDLQRLLEGLAATAEAAEDPAGLRVALSGRTEP